MKRNRNKGQHSKGTHQTLTTQAQPTLTTPILSPSGDPTSCSISSDSDSYWTVFLLNQIFEPSFTALVMVILEYLCPHDLTTLQRIAYALDGHGEKFEAHWLGKLYHTYIRLSFPQRNFFVYINHKNSLLNSSSEDHTSAWFRTQSPWHLRLSWVGRKRPWNLETLLPRNKTAQQWTKTRTKSSWSSVYRCCRTWKLGEENSCEDQIEENPATYVGGGPPL